MLKIVGLGPGAPDHITPRARDALRSAEVIVGYKRYVDMLPSDFTRGKELISTGMREEIDRCERAISATLDGKRTVVVSSGDAGIYGMAGLVLELLSEKDLLDRVDVEIIAGIPAFVAAAALLGAPVMHDFAVISLSDLLTPWELIQRRLEAAIRADLVLILYNPRSRRRDWQLDYALELVKRFRGSNVPVGIVKNAERPDQNVRILSVADFDSSLVDMLSVVIVGSSTTKVLSGKMVTPRGYLLKDI